MVINVKDNFELAEAINKFWINKKSLEFNEWPPKLKFVDNNDSFPGLMFYDKNSNTIFFISYSLIKL